MRYFRQPLSICASGFCFNRMRFQIMQSGYDGLGMCNMKTLKGRKKSRITRRTVYILFAVMLALGCTCGGLYYYHTETPELTSFVDESLDPSVSIEEDDVPLGKTKVTTKKKTKTSKKVVNLKKASKKTYKVKKPTKTETKNKTTKSSDQMVTVKTTIKTSVTESYKKKDKKKIVTTKVTTTTQTTTTDLTQTVQAGKGTSAVQTSAVNSSYTSDIDSMAPKADQRVRDAYNTLGFSVKVDPEVSYSGYFNAKSQLITLSRQDDTIYHELGHFLAFVAGNVDTKSSFVAIYNAEKGKYSGFNKTYVTKNSSEYFAESFRDYVLDRQSLKSSRPQTYGAIEQAMDKLTESYVSRVKTAYSAIWK